MSKSNKTCRRKIEIVGLITSIPYQTAIKCATEMARCHPRYFYKPKCRGMLEFDWDEHLTKQRRKFGGQLWALLRPVAVYINNQFIGSDEDFLRIINTNFVYSVPNCQTFFENAMIDDYTRYLTKSERLYVYLDINIDGKHIGPLIFQLYSDILPATCYNFRCLCTGDERKELCYKGTQIHRIAKMGWIQGGDNENITGGGGMPIYGAPFPDEGYCNSHDRRGVLSMANDGKHSNGSQFFVTLQPTLWMDYYYVAFGQLVEGVAVLKAIEAVEDSYEAPKKCIKIVDCGIVYEPTSKEYRKKRWPYESEEMRRGRLEERERMKKEKEEKDLMESEEGQALLKDPQLAPEVLDPRELDSNMYVDRYLDGFYYLFDAPPRVPEPEEEEEETAEQIASAITEELVDNTVNHVGRYIMEIVLRRAHGSAQSLEETNEMMIHRIVSDIVTRATIHLEAEFAADLVEEIIAKAVDTVQRLYKERSGATDVYDDANGTEAHEGEAGDGEDLERGEAAAEEETEMRVEEFQTEKEGDVEGVQEEAVIEVSGSQEVVGDIPPVVEENQQAEESKVEEEVTVDNSGDGVTVVNDEVAEQPVNDAPPDVENDAGVEAPVENQEAPVENQEEPEKTDAQDENPTE